MTLNKNAVFGDSSACAPGGVRLGTPAMTSRGCKEADMEKIADFLVKAAQISQKIAREKPKVQRELIKRLEFSPELVELRREVEDFSSSFEMPGFDVEPLREKRWSQNGQT